MYDVFATGDLHLGVGNQEDTCVMDWCYDLLGTFNYSNCRHFAVLGDWFELWKHKWYDVAYYNRDWFKTLALILIKKAGQVYYTPGNHDKCSIPVIKERLMEVGIGAAVVSEKICIGHHVLMHGHQFDPLCHGPMAKFSRAMTWFAGHTIEKIPGVEERFIDPTRWLSPANPSNERQEQIHKDAEEYATKNNIMLRFGHTHYAFQHGKRIANPGGLTKGHELSYMLLDTTSDDVLVFPEKDRYNG